jgi:hypothetical protein
MSSQRRKGCPHLNAKQARPSQRSSNDSGRPNATADGHAAHPWLCEPTCVARSSDRCQAAPEGSAGLWALDFGTATTGGTNTLLFSSGPNDENDGLIGSINPAP